MSNSIGQIDLDLGLNYKQFNNQLGGIAGTATNMVGGAFKKLGGIIAAAFAVRELVSFGKTAIGIASDLAEVQNVVDVTFGSMSRDIDGWSSDMIESFGLSELSAKRYSSTLGAMMKSSGLAGATMKDMSKDLTELSADMASFYNLSNDMAFEKIRSGISGETEPLKQLGINMSVANMEAYALSQGISKAYSKMSQAEQTMLRYNYLMSVTKDAQGDFARTSNSWANQVKIMGEQWRIFQGTMGAGFINILTPIVRGLNFVIKKLQIAAAYFKAFTEMIFGAQGDIGGTGAVIDAVGDSAGGAGDSLGGVGKAATGAGKAAKKAGKEVKGSLSSFDVLNVIGNDAADALGSTADALGDVGGGAGGLGDLGDFELPTPEITAPDVTVFQPLLDVLSQIKDAAIGASEFLAGAFGPPLQEALGNLLPEFNAWKDTIVATFSQFIPLWEPLKEWFTGDLVPFLQNFIVTASEILAGLSESARMVFEDLSDAVFPIIEWFVEEGLPLITDFADGALEVLKSAFDMVKNIFDTLWSEGVKPGLDLLSGIIVDTLDIIKDAWYKWGDKIVEGLKSAFDSISQLFNELWDKWLKPAWDYLLSALSELWENNLKGLVEDLVDFIGKLVDGALEIFNKFIAPIVSYLIDKLAPVFKAVWNGIVDVLKVVIGIISDIIKGVIKVFSGIVDFLVGVFTGDWKRAWEGIKTIFSGIGDVIGSIVKGIINVVKSILTFLADVFVAAWKAVWGIIKDVFNGIWEGIKFIVNGIIDVIKGIITYLTGAFTTAWNKVWNGIKDIVKNIGDAMSKVFKGVVNAIIDTVNFMTRQLNKISVDIPDWVPMFGGQSFGISIPEIPRLAKGGLATAPTMAMVGDNKNAQSDPEAILPISKLSEMLAASNSMVIEVLLMILNALEQLDFSVDIDGDKLTRLIKDKLRIEDGRVGRSGVTVGGVPVR